MQIAEERKLVRKEYKLKPPTYFTSHSTN